MSKDKPVLDSKAAKEKIVAGEEIKDVYIERLSLGKYEVTEPIKLTNCEIGTLDLNKATVKEEVMIRRCKIDMMVLSEATFEKKFDIKKTRVSRGRCQRTVFKEKAYLGETHLSFVSFHECVFEQKADFNRAFFHGDGTFTGAQFHGIANFVHVNFEKRAIFHKAVWHDKVDFKHIHVGADLELNDGTFHGQLLLNSAVIALNVDLYGSVLEGKVDFAQMQAGRTLSLRNVKVGENMGFRFVGSHSALLTLEREVVEGHVFPENEGDYATAAREYGFLRTAFAEINRFDDEDWAYYQFKRCQRLGASTGGNPLLGLQKLMSYLFLDLGCGYGTKPFRTLGVCGVMVLAFSFIFFTSVSAPPDQSYGFTAQILNDYMYAFDVSLLAFSGSYGDIKLTGPLRLFAMFEYMMGVVFMGLFVVAFSRKVIR